MHDKWKYSGTNFRLSKVSFPPYNQECAKHRAPCVSDITLRQGTAKGSCDQPSEVLFKVFSKHLESDKYTYAFDFLKNMQLTNEEVSIMLGQWAWNATLNNGKSSGATHPPLTLLRSTLLYSALLYSAPLCCCSDLLGCCSMRLALLCD